MGTGGTFPWGGNGKLEVNRGGVENKINSTTAINGGGGNGTKSTGLGALANVGGHDSSTGLPSQSGEDGL